MKFVTEMELRDLYKKETFETYTLEPQSKLTPEARQFLIDRGIKLVQTQGNGLRCAPGGTKAVRGEQNQRESSAIRHLRALLDRLESQFLLTGAELLNSGEAFLAEEILALDRILKNLKKAEQENAPPEDIRFWEWSEEEIRSCSNNLGKPLDISEFHIRLDKGKTIALLNHLRASLGEVEPLLMEAYGNEQLGCSRQDLLDKFNLMITILNIMLWKSLGGK